MMPYKLINARWLAWTNMEASTPANTRETSFVHLRQFTSDLSIRDVTGKVNRCSRIIKDRCSIGPGSSAGRTFCDLVQYTITR